MLKASEIRWPCIALVAIVIAMGFRPGDSPWYFDMSRNFDLALQFNATPSHTLGISLPFTPAQYGLKGTHGIRYGPLPIWIDQVFLAFTRNLITMSAIRAVAVGGLTALGLLWLTQLLRVSPWLAVVTMFSPWMWYYSRQLWDNSLCIPLSAVLFASYGQFLESRRARTLCLAVVCAALLCLTHLMVLPFLFVLAIHAIFFQTRWLLKFKWPLLATTILMFAISAPYLRYAVTFHGSHVPDYAPWWHGWLFPLLGAQHITGKNVGYFLEESSAIIKPALVRYAFTIARVITYIGILACWTGMIMAIPQARRALGRLREAGTQVITINQLCFLGWAAFLAQTLFDGLEHVSLYPHYYNTTWIIYVMFAWLAFDALPRWFGPRSVPARITVPVYAASLLFVEVIVAWQIARNGGSKGDNYSAVLSNQVNVVQAIDRFSDLSPIDMQVGYWQTRPDTLRVLRQLITPPADRPAAPLPVRRLVVRFRNAFRGDARIVVENFPVSDTGAMTPP
jgi:hypothetical protein